MPQHTIQSWRQPRLHCQSDDVFLAVGMAISQACYGTEDNQKRAVLR